MRHRQAGTAPPALAVGMPRDIGGKAAALCRDLLHQVLHQRLRIGWVEHLRRRELRGVELNRVEWELHLSTCGFEQLVAAHVCMCVGHVHRHVRRDLYRRSVGHVLHTAGRLKGRCAHFEYRRVRPRARRHAVGDADVPPLRFPTSTLELGGLGTCGGFM